jgi:hypothetical protein
MRVLTACVLGIALSWGWLTGYKLLCRELGKFFRVSVFTRPWPGQAHVTHEDTGDS